MKRLLGLLLLWPALALAGSVTHQTTVGTSAVRVDQTDPANRIAISIKGHSANSGTITCAPNDPGVTTGTGWDFTAKEGYSWNTAGSMTVKFYCIGSAAGQTATVEETTK